MTLYGTRIFTFWYSGNNTGGSYGVAWGKRNVHLTVWFRDEVMNCHITDGDRKVWEKAMTLAELRIVFERMQKKCIGRWRQNERMIILDPERLNVLKEYSMVNANEHDVDLGGYIRDILPAFLKSGGAATRIGDAMAGSPIFGLQYRRFKWFFVIATPTGEVLRWPVDPAKGPLRKVPTVQGFCRYMKYIDKEGFFDYIAPSMAEEIIERLGREVELAVIQIAGETDDAL